MDDFFKRIFGFPKRFSRGPDRSTTLDDLYDEKRDCNVPSNDFERFFFSNHQNSGNAVDFMEFSDDILTHMESITKQFDQMLHGFGMTDFFQFPISPPGPPSIGDGHETPDTRILVPTPFFNGPNSKNANPRDFMLKEPEREIQLPLDNNYLETPMDKQMMDSDLDGKLSSDEVMGLLGKHSDQSVTGPSFYSSGKSVFVTTTTDQNGKTTHKRVVKDSSGKEESTVTRSFGDQSHTLTTITSKDGLQEKRESFTNMDEGDLPKFEQKWSKVPCSTEPKIELFSNPKIQELDESEWDLFSRLFGKLPKN